LVDGVEDLDELEAALEGAAEILGRETMGPLRSRLVVAERLDQQPPRRCEPPVHGLDVDGAPLGGEDVEPARSTIASNGPVSAEARTSSATKFTWTRRSLAFRAAYTTAAAETSVAVTVKPRSPSAMAGVPGPVPWSRMRPDAIP
jgi:hypothetical protein